MREIKFRAWDNTEDVMRYDICITSNGNAESSWGKEKYDWAVMQFTGLKDKNGKDIFEGDIVQTASRSYGTWICAINFKYGCFGYNPFLCKQVENRAGWYEHLDKTFPGQNKRYDQVKTTGFAIKSFYPLLSDGTYSDFNLGDCQVIGNIHENPGLLKTQPNS